MAQVANKVAKQSLGAYYSQLRMRISTYARSISSGLACLLLVVAACIPAFFVSNIIGYIGILFIIILLDVCLLLLFISRRSLELQVVEMPTVFRRTERVQMGISLRNKSPFPISRVDVYVRVPSEQGGVCIERFTQVPLRGRSTQFLDLAVQFPHIGTYFLGIDSITVFDPSGLFWRTVEIDFACRVEVLPRIAHIENMSFSQRIHHESSGVCSDVTPDSMDYASTREFVQGDPLKLVNWKLSARGDTIYSKVLETYGSPSLSLIVDLSLAHLEDEDRLDVVDALAEITWAVAYTAKAKSMNVSVFHHDSAMNSVTRHFHHEHDLIPLLPRPQDTDRESRTSELLAYVCSNLHAGGNVVMCASQVQPEIAEQLAVLKQQGRNPLLILVTPEGRAPESVYGVSEALSILQLYSVDYLLCSSIEGLVRWA